MDGTSLWRGESVGEGPLTNRTLRTYKTGGRGFRQVSVEFEVYSFLSWD